MNYDIIVIGAGPAGLSVALQAKRMGMTALVLEKGRIVNSIQNFPRDMVFFSTVEQLAIGDVRFEVRPPTGRSNGGAFIRKGAYTTKQVLRGLMRKLAARKSGEAAAQAHGLVRKTSRFIMSTINSIPSGHPTRLEAIDYYKRVAEARHLEVMENSEVVSVKREAHKPFVVRAKNPATSETTDYLAERIVVATGYFDNPNTLGVPGENLPHVSHYYKGADAHGGQHVVVVGGNNSAVDTALDLHTHGIWVTIVHRGQSYSRNVKPWILPLIEGLVGERKIDALFNSKLLEINSTGVTIEIGGERRAIQCHFVYAMTGYRPDVDLLKGMGIAVDEETGVPSHNPATFETNVPGIFVAGSVTAGFDCDKVFIENGREHGKTIIRGMTA